MNTTLSMRRRLVLAAAVASGIAAVGCSRRLTKWEKQRPQTFKVRGRVFWDGKPEAGVLVAFESKANNLSAVGITDADGRFTLKTFTEGDGAAAGEHAVRLEKSVRIAAEGEGQDAGGRFGGSQVPGPATTLKSVLPQKYGDIATSGLSATVVKDGPNEFTFEIPGPRTVP
jgi:hypothetical protein